MHVIVLTKRKWITILVVAILILLLIGAGIWLLIKSHNDDTAVPTMAHVESYELQMIPYTAKVEIDQSLAILSTNCLTESLLTKQTEKAVILATNRSIKNCLMRPTL